MAKRIIAINILVFEDIFRNTILCVDALALYNGEWYGHFYFEGVM